jgi:hypothetical protein
MMDNILKLVLATLGLVGLLVMLIPSGNPLPPPPGSVVENATPSPPPVETAAPPAPSSDGTSESGGFVVDDNDVANFGKPMVDPTPPGQAQNPNQQPQSNGEPPVSETGQAAPGYTPQPAYPSNANPT